MARGFTGRGRGSLPAPKRQIANDGIDLAGDATLTFLATSNATALGTVAQLTIPPAMTLVRTRGRLFVRVNSSGTINNIITGAIGMLVVSLEAFNAGILSVSTPLDDIERAWFVWEPFALQGRVAAASAGNDIGAYVSWPFDSRGQRKLKTNDVLALVVEANQVSAVTGTVLSVGYSFRQQFKL